MGTAFHQTRYLPPVYLLGLWYPQTLCAALHEVFVPRWSQQSDQISAPSLLWGLQWTWHLWLSSLLPGQESLRSSVGHVRAAC